MSRNVQQFLSLLLTKMPKQRSFEYVGVLSIYFVIFILFFAPQLFTGQILAHGDGSASYLPLRLYLSVLAKEGFSLWMPEQFLGLPLIGSLQTAVFYPLNIFFYFSNPQTIGLWYNFSILLHYALAAFFTYLYTRLLGLKRWACFLSGIIFGASGFMMSHRSHLTIQNAAAWLPLLLYFFEKIRTKLELKYALLAGVTLAVQIFAGFFQVTAYSLLVLGYFTLYYSFYLPKKKFLFVGLCACSAIVGTLISSVQLVSTIEMSNLSLRGGNDYAFLTDYSFQPHQLQTLLIPFRFGGAYGVENRYSTDEMSVFMSTLWLVICCITVPLLWKKNIHVRFWLAVLVISFLLMLGHNTPLYHLIVKIPVLNQLRIPSRHILEFQLAGSILFGLGFNYLLSHLNNKKLLSIITFGFGELAFILFFILSVQKSSKVEYWIPLIFLSIYFLIFLFLTYRRKINHSLILVVLSCVVVVELYSFGNQYTAKSVTSPQIHRDLNHPFYTYVLAHDNLARVFEADLTEPSILNLPLGVSTLQGYDSLMPKTLHQFFGFYHSGMTTDWPVLLKQNTFLSALNIKYIVLNKSNFSPEIKNLRTQLNSSLIALPNSTATPTAFLTQPYLFQLTDNQHVNSLSGSLNIATQSSYLLTAEVKVEQTPNSEFIFQLSGNGITEKSNPKLVVDPSEVTSDYQTFYQVVYPTSVTVSSLSARAVSSSTSPYEAKNLFITPVAKEYFYPQHIQPSAQISTIYKPLLETKDKVLLENQNVLPRAFSIVELIPANSLQETKKLFDLQLIRPNTQATMYSSDIKSIGQTRFSEGTVEITEYQRNKVVLKTEFNEIGFVVLADQYFPGWKAYVENQELPIYQVNGLSRGVVVPSGKHQLRFVYEPIWLWPAGLVSLGVSFITFVLVFLAIKREHQKNPTPKGKHERQP